MHELKWMSLCSVFHTSYQILQHLTDFLTSTGTIYKAKNNCYLQPAFFILIIVIAHDLTETEVIVFSQG